MGLARAPARLSVKAGATAQAEAAGWVARLADGGDEASRAAFEAWRHASIAHEIAYEEAMAAWERLDGLSALRPFRAADVACPPAAHPEAKHPFPRWLAIAASLTLLAGTGSTMLLNADPAMAYATRVGETRQIRLADGTRVDLNTDTLILVHLKGHHREVNVVHGEALFHVTHDPRAFMISAGHLTLRADDADMAVRVDEDAAKVVVTRGLVEMSGKEEALGLGTMTIAPNTIARLTTDTLEVQQRAAPEISRQLAWRDGAIEFDGQSLAEALAEFNRYNQRQVRLADPALGLLRIGGYFHDDDLDGFLAAISQSLPLTARRDQDGHITLMRRDSQASAASHPPRPINR